MTTDAGEGTRTLTPPKETPDFKSAAYGPFPPPGGARIAPARGRLEARRPPVVLGRDLRRGLAVDDRVLVVLVEDDVVRVSPEALAVDVELEWLAGCRAIAADALLRQAHSPDTHELAEGEHTLLRRLEVNDPRGVVRVQLDEEAALSRVAVGVDSDERRHRRALAVDEDVQVLVDVQRRSLHAERAQLERRQAVRQRSVLRRPGRLVRLDSRQRGVVDRRRRSRDIIGARAGFADEDHQQHDGERNRSERGESIEHPRRPSLTADGRNAPGLRIAPLR